MSFRSESSSQGDSKGSKAPPSKDAEGTGSSFSCNSSKKKILVEERSEGSKASSDSQQPSPNNENPETDTEPALSQDADGKIFTFEPKDLLSKISEEERRQAWTISERDGTAELLEVCWLDVTGSMTATKGKAYEISFILSMNEDNFGWELPVYVMARIGEEEKYTRVKIDLSKLGQEKEEFPKEKYCRVEFRSDGNAGNNEKKLYFGLYEVWTNKWKGGLRIHKAIVRELTAEDSASASDSRLDDSKVQVTADKSTSASENPPHNSIDKQVSTASSSQRPHKNAILACFGVPTSRNYQ